VIMLKAVPKSIFSWDFTVSLAGQPIAEVDTLWFREKAEMFVDGQRYGVYRERWMSGLFVLESGAGVLATAEKPSAFFRSFKVHYGSRRFQLEALSPFTRSFSLAEGVTPVGTIRPVFWLSRTTTIDLPNDIVLPVQVFMFWLVLILWRRATSSGGGAAAGA
jgi:hypothetical protein